MSKCLACGKPTKSAVRLHPACKPALIGGKWAPGLVQFWQETEEQEPRITAQPSGPEVLARLETLSKTEANVLRLLACGHTPNEVAAIRFNSVETIWDHAKAIRQKLGVQSQVTAVALAWRSGWITLADAADPALGKEGAA